MSKSNSGGGEILEVMNLRDKTFALLQDLCTNNQACKDLLNAVCSLSDCPTATMELCFSFADRVRDETLIIDELHKAGEDYPDPMVALGALKAEIARRKKKEAATADGGEEMFNWWIQSRKHRPVAEDCNSIPLFSEDNGWIL